MTLALLPGVIDESFAQLRRCGHGRRECVVYWVGPIDDPGVVDEVVHPAHSAHAIGYEVDSGWITQLFLRLRRDRRTVRAQVHTHPGKAGHSSTDDTFSLVPSTGFLSLVIPRFATGPTGMKSAYLAELNDAGAWIERDPTAVIV